MPALMAFGSDMRVGMLFDRVISTVLVCKLHLQRMLFIFSCNFFKAAATNTVQAKMPARITFRHRLRHRSALISSS
jgi:hypothetical protein